MFTACRLLSLCGMAAWLALAGCAHAQTTVQPQPSLPATRPSASLEPQALLMQAFPGWLPSDDNTVVSPMLPAIGPNDRPLHNSTRATRARVLPLKVVRLDDHRAVLLTHASPLDAPRPGSWLGAYVFERQPDRWALVRRQDAVGYQAHVGRFGTGDSAVHRIAPSRRVFAQTVHACERRRCRGWLSAWELRADGMQPVLDRLPVMAASADARPGCVAVLAGRRPAAPPRGRSASPSGTCRQIDGKPTFEHGARDAAPGALRLRFTGIDWPAGQRVRRIDETAVYTLKDGRYRLSRGRNPLAD